MCYHVEYFVSLKWNKGHTTSCRRIGWKRTFKRNPNPNLNDIMTTCSEKDFNDFNDGCIPFGESDFPPLVEECMLVLEWGIKETGAMQGLHICVCGRTIKHTSAKLSSHNLYLSAAK